MPSQPVPRRTTSEELIRTGSNDSSDFLNIEEPPAPSKTPDPATYFPLKRRSSANYKAALLGNRLQKTKIDDQDTEITDQDPLSTKPEQIDISTDAQVYDPQEEGHWSPEGTKRTLQRRSTGLGSDFPLAESSQNHEFNVQYRGSVSYPPQSNHSENAPNSRFHHIPRCYHSNQQSPGEFEDHHDYFPRSFEYADFKRRMSKDQ